MKLNIKKNYWIGLKGLAVSLIAGAVTGIAQAIIAKLGIIKSQEASWGVSLIVGLTIGVYLWGLFGNKLMKWN